MQKILKLKPLLAIILVSIFALIAVFGISIFTGNKQQSNVANTQASAQEPSDINNDNKVDVFDLSILLSKWNTADATSDITNDGTVNIFDLSVLLSDWGVAISPSPVLPKQGISTGYKIITRNVTDRRFELDKIQRLCNGKPCFIRLDSTTGNQAQLEPVVDDAIARGLTPLLILYGTTGPRSADNFGHDQAVKWLGKVNFFEITNEPDLHGWTPDGLADFTKATSISIKSGNPNAAVIAGALWKQNVNYNLQDYTRSLALRASGYFDYLSIHLYEDPRSRADWNVWDMTFPVIFGINSYYKGNTAREILDSNGLSHIPIISSETGGSIDTYGENGQNSVISSDFDALDDNLVASILVFSAKNDDVPGFGLLRDDNSERPSFTTFMNRAK